MGRVRALLAALVTLCGLLLGGAEVLAADTGKLEIISGGTVVRDGQEMEFAFSLEGYSDIKSGVNALKGTLEYDSAVFKISSQEDFKTANSWEKLFYNPENGQFILINRKGSMQDEEVFRLSLTAEQAIPAGETAVTVKNLSVSEGGEELAPADAVLKLSAVSEYPGGDGGQYPEDGDQPSEEEGQAPEGEQQPDGEVTVPAIEDQPAGNNPGASINLQGKGGVQAGDPVDGFLPAAGIFFGSALLIGAVIYWRKKEKLSGRAKLLTGVIACMGVAALAAGSVYAFAGKGDLNGDGNTDYADVELLEKHLIDLEPLTVNRKDAADLNSDGTLTVTDLSLLIRKIEKTVDYEVALSSAMEQFHYEKREKVELKFLADVSYDARIEKVTVNGKEYEAEKEEGSSLYTVRTEAGETAGVKEFYITEVLLEGGQRIKTNHTEKIDVLKTMPEVEGFLAEELTNTAQMKVTVFLKMKILR